MKNIAFVLSLFIGFSAFSQDRKIEFRHLTWAETLEASKTENKPIFIDCYTTWCGPCKWMSANIFTDNSVADYFNENYIAVKFDMEKGEGLDLANQFKIRAYPTLVHTNAKEEILFVSVGADPDPKSYIANAKQALDPENNLLYYQANKDEIMSNPKKMLGYFKMMSNANMVTQSDVDAYFKQFPVKEWTSDSNWEIITMTLMDGNNEIFKTIVENDNLFTDKHGVEAADFIANIYFYDLANMFYRAKTDEQKSAYAKKKRETLSSDFSQIKKVEFMIDSFEAERTGEWETFSKLNAENGLKYYAENANKLNDIAWSMYEHTENSSYLNSALAMAEKATKLSESHAIMDTYANLLLVTGNPQRALEVETKALELAKKEGSNTKSYEEVISKINQAL
jgi:thiol-disulfide isomerase/thioredoxin